MNGKPIFLYSGNKQLQFLMGLNSLAYWIANFLWDLMLYMWSIGLVYWVSAHRGQGGFWMSI